MNLNQKEIQEIKAYRKKFPQTLKVEVIPCQEGGFAAQIHSFPGAFTQGKTWSELVFMVNDAVQCIIDVPEKYTTFMPNYSPPYVL